uniref:Uncharacterized protein n=1 Tax=Astatotilapia calliptera TaxID=8154 RepID=A0AAX7VRK6_ASTCA
MLLTSHMKSDWFSPSVSPSDSMRPDSWTKCADDEKHEAYQGHCADQRRLCIQQRAESVLCPFRG